MSYNIAQLRRDQISSYSTSITWTQGYLERTDTTVDMDFYDAYLKMSSSLTANYSYYLKFTVNLRTDNAQKFTIVLKNSEASEDNEQDIKTITASLGNEEEEETESFELIFTPNSSYDQLVFQLSRVSADFYLSDDNGISGTNGRNALITIDEFYIINNIINTFLVSAYDGLENLLKIGIQGPPGLLFCLNGEEMRIGRSGIYELYYDNLEITYLGFVIKESSMTQDGLDYFIMDFKY